MPKSTTSQPPEFEDRGTVDGDYISYKTFETLSMTMAPRPLIPEDAHQDAEIADVSEANFMPTHHFHAHSKLDDEPDYILAENLKTHENKKKDKAPVLRKGELILQNVQEKCSNDNNLHFLLSVSKTSTYFILGYNVPVWTAAHRSN